MACTIGRGTQTGDLDLIGKTLGGILSAKWVEDEFVSSAYFTVRQEGKCGFGGACAVLFNVSGWAMAFGCLGIFFVLVFFWLMVLLLYLSSVLKSFDLIVFM